jgi:hypothetical protein
MSNTAASPRERTTFKLRYVAQNRRSGKLQRVYAVLVPPPTTGRMLRTMSTRNEALVYAMVAQSLTTALLLPLLALNEVTELGHLSAVCRFVSAICATILLDSVGDGMCATETAHLRLNGRQATVCRS